MSDKKIKRNFDLYYLNYQSLPGWKRIVGETVYSYLKDNGFRDSSSVKITIHPISQMNEEKFRVNIEPPQEINEDDLSELVILNLRKVELDTILQERQESLLLQFDEYRRGWEKSFEKGVSTWKNKIEAKNELALKNMKSSKTKYDSSILAFKIIVFILSIFTIMNGFIFYWMITEFGLV